VKEDEAIRNFAFSAMANHLDDVISLVERVTFCTLEQRLASFLCCQFDNESRAKPAVLSLTHDQIAAELGSAREVISRHLRELERKGGVSLGRGHIRLNDINLLKNIYKVNQH
jgi:CRP/FNR family transcriptional regulator